ncbi:ABC transporter substrate-binding protein [Paenibacillus eucommiae]|uniref:Iron complex transport system substrate-binding protein n=1 Tax=Paenibacillus eucommiae TaxID=1355755 RepID=A0ABS4JAV2_9BACL|nr:ABC transporter substrate-binding protein [Paenibacillus eucommiae]MBP1996981.1 iron complex transport system substrate-binding protein [Paenibacillus eucommiae]
MRKNKIAAFICLAISLLILAACGSSGGADQANNKSKETANSEQASQPGATVQPADQSAGQQTDQSGKTRKITHLRGEVEVPVKIERAVVLSAAYIDHLLTIGEKPYGVNVEVRYGGDYLPYLANELEGVQLVGSADSPNLEAIVQLNPDVILIESRTADETYAQLEKIAPTIVLGTEWLEYENDTTYWTKDLLLVAELYDKVDLAKEKIAELEAKTAEAKKKIQGLDNKRLAYLRVREKNLQIYAEKGHPTNTLLYNDLGFSPTALTPAEQRGELSLEVVPNLNADYIVLEVDPNGRDNLKSINESVLWKKVPAVEKEQVYETDSFWLFKGWGVIGRGQIIDEVLKMIE